MGGIRLNPTRGAIYLAAAGTKGRGVALDHAGVIAEIGLPACGYRNSHPSRHRCVNGLLCHRNGPSPAAYWRITRRVQVARVTRSGDHISPSTAARPEPVLQSAVAATQSRSLTFVWLCRLFPSLLAKHMERHNTRAVLAPD